MLQQARLRSFDMTSAQLLSRALVCLRGAQNKLNINDWSSVQSLFDKLNKQMEKAQKATELLGAPRVYLKMLIELEVRPLGRSLSLHLRSGSCRCNFLSAQSLNPEPKLRTA